MGIVSGISDWNRDRRRRKIVHDLRPDIEIIKKKINRAYSKVGQTISKELEIQEIALQKYSKKQEDNERVLRFETVKFEANGQIKSFFENKNILIETFIQEIQHEVDFKILKNRSFLYQLWFKGEHEKLGATEEEAEMSVATRVHDDIVKDLRTNGKKEIAEITDKLIKNITTHKLFENLINAMAHEALSLFYLIGVLINFGHAAKEKDMIDLVKNIENLLAARLDPQAKRILKAESRGFDVSAGLKLK
jgi:hypothetical protein